ncbi:hypothetical protein EDD21DRAFT_393810 [Dissophora ornata]|nr:hypothetical protein BGZ58_008896 [Dissophora ornata]KAI8594304.1 hypothetical protein EDD21DRAFT_393810 [Dissophora ornata]
MSTVDVATPDMSSTLRPKRGLASFKTMFSTKRHSIALIPGAVDSAPSSPSPSEPSVDSPTSSESSSQKSSNSVTALFAPNQKRALEKAAEKEKKEQVKQAIQLSTVDEQGAFLPPTPLEKGYKDHFKDNDEDFFHTIISTPPERVRTFLSAASTISPGMFSLPSSKIKRHTVASFPSAQSSKQWSTTAVSPEFVDEDLTTSPLSPSPPMVPPKDAHYTPKQSKKNTRVQIAYLTGTGDLSEALSESIGSLLTTSGPSSPSQEVPDLMDDDGHSGSESSASSSPRHSTASLQDDHRYYQQSVKHKAMNEQSFGGELPLAH